MIFEPALAGLTLIKQEPCDDMEIVQTLLLAAIVVILIYGLSVLNGIAKKFTDAVDKLLIEIHPAIKSIHEQVENLKPAIDAINARRAEIDKVICELPSTIANYKEISDNVLPATRLIAEKTPDIKNSIEVISSTAGRLKNQADALNERMRPTVGSISGVAQAIMEGFKVFKSFKR
jgi:methyl-accepting chemotaxis protein